MSEKAPPTVTMRRGRPADAAILGDICHRAFKAVAETHNYPPDLPNAEMAAGLLAPMLGREGFFDLVAERDGTIIGSNFLDERNPISGVGPITVDPARQNSGVGRALMQAVIARSAERASAGIRLVQAGYHLRSLALYASLGFEARALLACLQGPPIGEIPTGVAVRAATAADLSECNRLCRRVHGHDRGGELREAILDGAARVVVRDGRLTGYATPVAFFGHAVGETTGDLKALIGAAPEFPGPGFLLPTRNGELLRWCLAKGLKIRQTMTLMSMGLYNEPDGAWLPSVTY